MTDVVEYLTSKNISFRREGQEAVIVCPQCMKEKLYVNVNTGLFHCFVCEAEQPNSPYVRGHISKLQEDFGDVISITKFISTKNKQDINLSILVDQYHSNIFNHKQAKKYLFRRGISEDSIKRFKLGTVFMKDHDWISIPSIENGIPKLIKYRQIPPEDPNQPKYVRETGSKSILFNGDIIDNVDTLIITEGELDATTLIQNGYENVVGITGGAGTLLPEWFDRLLLKQKIFLIFDKDEAGQNAARDVWATRLGLSKCWNVLLEGAKDINEFFLTHKKEDFDKLLVNAHLFKIEGVTSLPDALYEIYNRAKNPDNIKKYRLPWENVNKLIGGGLVRKRLTVCGGYPGSGKTSFAIQIIYHLYKEYKLPSLYWCMEMPEVDLATKILQLEKDLSYEQINPSDALTWSQEMEGVPIYFGYSSKIKPDVFYNTMKLARDRYGVGIGVFDNLQRLVRSDSEADMAKASGMFKDLVMDLNIMFLLISQPRKRSMEDQTKLPTYDELKGSSAIPADADEVIILYRKRMSGDKDEEATSLESSTRVIVDKSRFSSGGTARLQFIGNKSRFEE